MMQVHFMLHGHWNKLQLDGPIGSSTNFTLPLKSDMSNPYVAVLLSLYIYS